MDAENGDSLLFFSPPEICLEVLNNHCGGVRPPSPPRHDTTAPEEPTPARVQPPRQAKTKDAEFHYTK